jgi:hypothetical protein
MAGVSSMTVGPAPTIILPANPSADAVVFRNQVMGLSRAASHRSVSSINNVYANFELASAAITLFSHPAWDDVTSSSTLKSVMAR